MISGNLSLRYQVTLQAKDTRRAIIVAILTAAALAGIMSFQPVDSDTRLEAGQVSQRTILAPDRITYASEFQTREAQAKAITAVREVYDPPSAELAREQVRRASNVLDFVDTVRHDPYTEIDQKVQALAAVPDLNLPAASFTRILNLDEDAYHRMATETLYVVDLTMREEVHPGDLSAAQARLPTRVSLALPADQADLVVQWARPFIVANSFYNHGKTEEQRVLARDRVGTVYRTIERGEAILREGEIITPLAMEALQELRLLTPRRNLFDSTAAVLLAIAIVFLLSAHIVRVTPALIASPRALILVAVLLLLAAISAKAFVPQRTALAYLIPFSTVAMLIAVLINVQTAIGASVAAALIVGFLGGNSFEIGTYVIVGGLVAALGLGRIERQSAFLWGGLYVAVANLMIAVIFRVGSDANLTAIIPYVLAALGHAALAALIAFGSLFFLSRLFGITTTLDLVELTRPTHPLLQKLLTEAPGTYHHSLIVGQLAEQAAQQIGADGLLVRVGAYYHDVGKTRNPHVFVENQLDGINVHDTLDPHTSAALIMEHVPLGLELAEQYGLPPRIREFIPQHHGTTLAAYFHHKAKEDGGTTLDESEFRYAGPKPQTREAGILMLADGVEATARAERPTAPEQINAIIKRILDERLRDGQLDESDLTLQEIHQIREAFFGVLQGLFHPRVKYPKPDEERQPLDRRRVLKQR